MNTNTLDINKDSNPKFTLDITKKMPFLTSRKDMISFLRFAAPITFGLPIQKQNLNSSYSFGRISHLF